MQLDRIRFTKAFSPYRKGEIAGFTPDSAKKYIGIKVAYYCDKDGNEIDEPEDNDVNLSGITAESEQDITAGLEDDD